MLVTDAGKKSKDDKNKILAKNLGDKFCWR